VVLSFFFLLFCHHNYFREWRSIESRRATWKSYDYKQAKNDVGLFYGGETGNSVLMEVPPLLHNTHNTWRYKELFFFPFYVTIRVKKCIFLFAKLGAVPLALVLASRSDDTCVVDVCRKLQDLCCDGESSNPISFILINLDLENLEL
jgi:hypothetical protein